MKKGLPLEVLFSIGVVGVLLVMWAIWAAGHIVAPAPASPTATRAAGVTLTATSFSRPTSSPTPVPSLTATLAPTWTPTFAATAPPSPMPTAPVIVSPTVSLQVSPSVNVPLSATLTLRWQVDTYPRARIVEQVGAWVSADQRTWEVEPEGTLEIVGPTKYDASVLYILYVFDRAGEIVASDQVQVTMACPYEWFFDSPPAACPDGPARTVQAISQSFEGGWMVWLASGPWSEEPVIYVLYQTALNGHMWEPVADAWHEGMPLTDPDLEPPAGRFQPVGRLGQAWRDHPQFVRQPLGWATAEEVAYTARLQHRSTGGRYPTLYILAADQRIYVLHPEQTRWEFR